MVPVLVSDPTVGLFAPTESSKGAVLTQKFLDGVGDMVSGRTPLGTLNQLLQAWRDGGGDQIRSEFEQAYSNSK
jgi:putative aldouronate transport system substrate-binding protein